MADIDIHAQKQQPSPDGDEEIRESSVMEPLVLPAAKKGEPRLHKYLWYVVELKASDLHFKSNARVHIRHKGDLKPLKGPPLTAQEVEDIWFEVMNEHQRRQLAEKGASDFAYQLGESDRFRVNIFRQRGVLRAGPERETGRDIPKQQVPRPGQKGPGNL